MGYVKKERIRSAAVQEYERNMERYALIRFVVELNVSLSECRDDVTP